MNRQVLPTVFAALLIASSASAQRAHRTIRQPYLEPEMTVGTARGIGSESKRNLALDWLIHEKSTTRGPNSNVVRLGAEEQTRLGIDAASPDPMIMATVVLMPGGPVGLIRKAGVTVLSAIGPFVTVRGPMDLVAGLADDPRVKRVDMVSRSRSSTVRLTELGPVTPVHNTVAGPYTGRAVAVGVFDTGIDWRHRDFIKRDGSTRILALYDITDDSWEKSHGKIGYAPPITDENGPLGTVYSSAQINRALRGKYKIASMDHVGHGTAVAGVAAGNGLAAKSKYADYRGVAPDASLIIVRAGDESMTDLWAPFAKWARKIAGEHRMPLVINISAGTQYTAHDGTLSEESELDEYIRSDNKGLAVVTAAGNEAADQIVATGRFGPRVKGQADFEGREIEMTSRPSNADTVPPVVCYFKHQDDWGLFVSAKHAPFLDEQGNPISMQITAKAGKPMVAFSAKADIDPKVKQKLARSIELSQTESGEDSLSLPMPEGVYTLCAFGSGPKVSDGRFMFSLPMGDSSFFSMGASNRFTVCSPGNASSVITVGSYNNSKNLPSRIGVYRVNSDEGEISEFSSRGFRRDGVVKPDIVGPGCMQVSSLAEGCQMQKEALDDGGAEIAPSGKHQIWQGTSASAPYVTGVIALMLQKNPRLSSEQIRKILIRSAKTDRFTGAVPNPDFGYGKIDPEKALRETPAPRRGN